MAKKGVQTLAKYEASASWDRKARLYRLSDADDKIKKRV